jgi:hypothetical protein
MASQFASEEGDLHLVEYIPHQPVSTSSKNYTMPNEDTYAHLRDLDAEVSSPAIVLSQQSDKFGPAQMRFRVLQMAI